ncbi:hypothetical protein NC651_026587 [Populus alba x Populus x berolinensis]|nr:hypothetical protein NC651_026587 [Populus alba x Populus x berolinensis]
MQRREENTYLVLVLPEAKIKIGQCYSSLFLLFLYSSGSCFFYFLACSCSFLCVFSVPCFVIWFLAFLRFVRFFSSWFPLLVPLPLSDFLVQNPQFFLSPCVIPLPQFLFVSLSPHCFLSFFFILSLLFVMKNRGLSSLLLFSSSPARSPIFWVFPMGFACVLLVHFSPPFSPQFFFPFSSPGFVSPLLFVTLFFVSFSPLVFLCSFPLGFVFLPRMHGLSLAFIAREECRFFKP